MKKEFFSKLLLLYLYFQASVLFTLAPSKSPYTYQHNVWNMNDGLPCNTVCAIAQTPGSYLWSGTVYGLVRFDGVDFEVYDPENTPAFINYHILCLEVDRQGTLWIGTRGGGLVRWQNGTFEAFSKKYGLLNDEIWDIMESSDGAIWIGSRQGLHRFYNGKMSPVPLPASISGHSVHALLEDRIGRIWVGTRGGGLVTIARRAQTFESEHKGFEGLKINALLEDHMGTIWVGTMNSGLIRLKENNPFFYSTKNGLTCNCVYSLYGDQSGNLWIGTNGGGINILSGKDDHISVLNGKGNLTGNSIFCFFKDIEGTLWIGTISGGLNCLRDTKLTTYAMHHGLSYDTVLGVFQDSRDNVWIGTKGFGVNCWNLESQQIRVYTTRDGLSVNSVVSIAEYPRGSLWFGTYGSGVNRLNIKNGRVDVFNKHHGLSDPFIQALYVDQDNIFWAGSDDGGVHYFSNGKFRLYRDVDYRVNTIHKDLQGNLWIGTYGGGLFRLDNKYTEVYDEKKGFTAKIVNCIFEDKNGILWIGSKFKGLYLYKDGSFINIGKKDGLPCQSVYCILEDGRNNLWMSSNRGIFYVRQSEVESVVKGLSYGITPILFGKKDGMKSLECLGGFQPAGWRTRDGKLWFPTTKGVTVIDPENIGANNLPPPVQIKKLVIDNKSYPPGKKAVVPPGKGNIDIHYTALSFIEPKKILFKYKLTGYDKQWIKAGNRRTATYSGIPPGSYSFRVIACNSDGVWNSQGVMVEIDLKPKFYQTLAFQIGGVLIVVFLLSSVFIFHYFTQKANHKKLRSRSVKTSALSQEEKKKIQKIFYMMEVEEIYKNSDVSIKSLASMLSVSQRHLSEIINNHLQTNFKDFITRYRIKEAQRLLTDPDTSDISILEIAYEVGYNSKSSFNLAFKNYTSMTPTQFRKNQKKDIRKLIVSSR